MLCEILIKSCKCKFDSGLLNYFGFKNGEGICNAITFDNNTTFGISSIGLNHLINWDCKIQKKYNNDYELYEPNTTTINDINFFHNGNQLKVDRIIMIKEIETWLNDSKHHFDTIDNSFKLNQVNVIKSASSLIILKTLDNTNNNYLIRKTTFERNNITIGEEIYSINSNLSFISKDHFISSYSKGYISNKITKNIYLIDIRAIPNMLMSMIYNMKNQQEIMIICTVLNIARSYTPLIFGFRLDELRRIINLVFNPSISISDLDNNLIPQQIHLPSSSKYTKAIYLIHDLKKSATCFHIGNGILITNKHFFSQPKNSNISYTITNHYYSFQCKPYFIPDNSFDIALIKIHNQPKELIDTLPNIPIESYDYSIYPLHEFYLYQYSIFSKEFFLNKLSMPNRTTGCISKVVKYKSKTILYQLDSCCFNGASGSPLISNATNKLIGVVYQNLSINNIQLPSISFAIAKEILNEIYDCINDLEKLKNIWVFSIPHEDIDHTIYLSLYKCKL